MSLKNFFQPQNLIFDLTSESKQDIIVDLVSLLAKNNSLPKTTEELVKEFMKRESRGSTALQNGIAVPHIKSQDIKEFYLAIGIHHRGLDFKSIDNKPTHVIFLLIVPLAEVQTHLQFLSIMSRLFLNKNLTSQILQKNSPEHICSFFKEIFHE